MVKKYSLEIFILNGLFKGELIKISVSNRNILILLHNTINYLFWKHVILFVFQNKVLILIKDIVKE